MVSTDGYILHRDLAEGKASKAEEHTQSQGVAMSPIDKVSKAEEHTQSQEISMGPTNKVTGCMFHFLPTPFSPSSPIGLSDALWTSGAYCKQQPRRRGFTPRRGFSEPAAGNSPRYSSAL